MNGGDKFRYSQLKFVVFIGRFQFHRFICLFLFIYFFPTAIFDVMGRTVVKKRSSTRSPALQKPST